MICGILTISIRKAPVTQQGGIGVVHVREFDEEDAVGAPDILALAREIGYEREPGGVVVGKLGGVLGFKLA